MPDNFKLRFAKAKVEIQKRVGKPSGRATGKITFNYWETGDFLPIATEVFAENHIVARFQLEDRRMDGETITREKGVLYIHDCDSDEMMEFISPTEDVTTLSSRIQGLGAKITYLKRYAYINALDLAENDIVEAKYKADNKPVRSAKPSNDQLKALFAKLGQEGVKKLCDGCGVQSSKDLPLNVVEFYLASETADE